VSEVIVVATLAVRPGMEDAAEDLVTGLVEPTHAEDGCLLYAVHRSLSGPRVLSFVERWQSAELLDRHLANAHVQAFNARAGQFFSDVQVHRFEAVALGEADKGSLEGHGAAR